MISNHEKFTESIPGYSLGALDGEDLRDLESHLKNGCPECEALLAECKEAVSQIARSVSPVTPPERVKTLLMERIQAGKIGFIPKTSPPAPSLWQRLEPIIFKFAAGAAAASLLVYFSLSNLSLKNSIDERRAEISKLEKRIAEQSGGEAALRNLMSKKDSEIAKLREHLSLQAETVGFLANPKVIVINLTGSQSNYKSSGKVLWDTKTNNAMFIGAHLPPIPSGKTYQLWAVTDHAAVSVAVFKVDEEGNNSVKFLGIPTSEKVQKFAVSLEPDGGVPQPTGEIYLAGNV